MNNSQNPIARQNGLVVQEMPDEILVYDLDSNKAHCLNRSSAFVWRSCDGRNSVADIVREFELKAEGKVTEDFVWLAIDQLSEKDLLQIPVTSKFAGQSRRQVLKTIGLVSVVALPVIASLVAPRNAVALASCSCLNSGACMFTSCPSTTCCNTNSTCGPAIPTLAVPTGCLP